MSVPFLCWHSTNEEGGLSLAAFRPWDNTGLGTGRFLRAVLEPLGKAISMQKVNHYYWEGSMAGSKHSKRFWSSRLQVLSEPKRGFSAAAAAPEQFWRLVAALAAGTTRGWDVRS